MKARPRLCAWSLSLLLVDACPAPRVTPPSKPVATCRVLTGTAEIRRASSDRWEPLVPDAVVATGDSLRTGAKSAARLELLGGGSVDLDASGELAIGSEFERPASESLDVLAFEVATAHFAAVLEPRPGGKERAVVVGTSDGTRARLRRAGGDSRWGFRVDATGRTALISVSTGKVQVEAGGRTHELRRGEAVDVGGGTMGEVLLLPAAPAIASPAPGARLNCSNPTPLRWAPVAGVDVFRVQVTHGDSFEAPALERSVQGVTADFVEDGAGPYSWRVAGVDKSGRVGEFSAATSFWCEPTAPDGLLFPADGVSVPTGRAVAFSWQAAPGASRYRLVVTRGPEVSGPVAFEQATQRQLITARLPVGEYLWGAFAEAKGEWTPLFQSLRSLRVRRGESPGPKDRVPAFNTPNGLGWDQ